MGTMGEAGPAEECEGWMTVLLDHLSCLFTVELVLCLLWLADRMVKKGL